MTEAQHKQSGVAPWAVHLFTASGVILALLALAAVMDDDARLALVWLVVAIVIDGVDGTLARRVRVKERLPRIDGEALDLIIDYLTYVFIPALIIWRGAYLPDPLAFPLTAAILVASLYNFARRDMKTDDGYFRGFPALWIFVAFYCVLAPVEPALLAVIVVALIVLTFAPILVIHPFRARDFGPWPAVVTLVGLAAIGALYVPAPGTRYATLFLSAAAGAVAILFAMGLVRTVRGPRPQ